MASFPKIFSGLCCISVVAPLFLVPPNRLKEPFPKFKFQPWFTQTGHFPTELIPTSQFPAKFFLTSVFLICSLHTGIPPIDLCIPDFYLLDHFQPVIFTQRLFQQVSYQLDCFKPVLFQSELLLESFTYCNNAYQSFSHWTTFIQDLCQPVIFQPRLRDYFLASWWSARSRLLSLSSTCGTAARRARSFDSSQG